MIGSRFNANEVVTKKQIPKDIFGTFSPEYLKEGFQNIPFDFDSERLDKIMDSFCDDNWAKHDADKSAESMAELVKYISEACGLKESPCVTTYLDEFDANNATYYRDTNTIDVNLKDSWRAGAIVKSLAHETWHAYQHQCAENPEAFRDYQYRLNIENYVDADEDEDLYRSQFVEQEANAFAEYFVEAWQEGDLDAMKEIKGNLEEVKEPEKNQENDKAKIVENLMNLCRDFSENAKKQPENITEKDTEPQIGKHFVKQGELYKVGEGGASSKVKLKDEINSRLDDNGVKYRDENGLLSNIKYTLNTYTYNTDKNRRIIYAEAKELKKIEAPRNDVAQRIVGGADRKSTDHGGHLIASIFNGHGDIGNLVPMNGNLNQGAYKRMENDLSKALDAGKSCSMRVTLKYEENSMRPTIINVKYTIDGETFSKKFINKGE